MKKLLLSCLSIIAFQATLFAQSGSTFKDGERLTYTASYKMGGFMTQLAQVNMETDEVKTSSNTLYHFKCRASTYPRFDAFFKIRDLYESYVSKSTLLPRLYKRDINEGSYKKKMKYVYNQKNRTIKSTQTKRRRDGTDWVVDKTFKFNSGAMDVVSMIYNVRNLPIHNAAIGDSKTFSIIFDKKETPVTLTLTGKEKVTAGNLGTIECYKLRINTPSSFLKAGTLWISADANKVPVKATFTIPVGTGVLLLKSATGLAN